MSVATGKKYGREDLKDLVGELPRPPRLKALNVPKDFENLQYLDDEEKDLVAVQLISRLEKFDKPATITVASAAHDPKAARIRSAFGGALMDLVATSYETRHLVGGTLTNLLVLNVMKHAGDECLSGGIARYTLDHHLESFKPHHLFLMDFPESEVWNKEQRLMLRWSKAVLENTMTDELWNEAVDAWNPKMCIRYIHVINFFLGAAIMNRTLRLPYPMTTEAADHVNEETKINKERREYLKKVGKA